MLGRTDNSNKTHMLKKSKLCFQIKVTQDGKTETFLDPVNDFVANLKERDIRLIISEKKPTIFVDRENNNKRVEISLCYSLIDNDLQASNKSLKSTNNKSL